MITWMTFWFDFSKKQHIEEMADAALTFASQALNLAPARMRAVCVGGYATAATHILEKGA